MSKMNNQEELLEYLKTKRVKAKGCIINAQWKHAHLSGSWRNDTNGFVILTGLYFSADAATSSPAEMSLQVGDRQITGGSIATTALATASAAWSSSNQMLSWPGFGVPVAPGEVVKIAGTTAPSDASTVFAFTAVSVLTYGWKPERAFLESRFQQLTPQATTGQQALSAQIGYSCIVWDWFRSDSAADTNYQSTVQARLHLNNEPVTLNNIPGQLIPGALSQPASEIFLVQKRGFNINYYIDNNSAGLSPGIIVRLAKFWGDK